MASRNIWTHEETNIMLKVIAEKKCMEFFDGKKYRNSEIYKLIEKEMNAKGITTKNSKQIEIRWKNLKRSYILQKKRNNTSGEGRDTSNFFEELDEILGSRPSVTAINAGVDSFEGAIETVVVTPDLHEDDIPSTSNKRRKVSSRSTTRHLEMVAAHFEKLSKKINDEFLAKQKELVEFECELFDKQEKERQQKFQEIIEKNTRQFLDALQARGSNDANKENSSKSGNLSTYFSTFNEDDLN